MGEHKVKRRSVAEASTGRPNEEAQQRREREAERQKTAQGGKTREYRSGEEHKSRQTGARVVYTRKSEGRAQTLA